MKNDLKILLVLSFGLLSACAKKEAEYADIDYNRLSLKLTDNFNLSVFSAAIDRGGLHDLLLEDGPFTVLAPTDDAFKLSGYTTTTSIRTEALTRVSRIANYHVLSGEYELNKLPFLFNQEIQSRGGKLYVTHWIKGQDTVLTINGALVLTQNIPASNGLIQMINRMLEPYVYDELGSAIAAEPSLTIFTEALYRSGLLETLKGEGPFTVFAPNNRAMQAYGFPTVQSVDEADPEVLAAFLKYHIVTERSFVNDYILSTGDSHVSQQAMMDGNSVTVSLIASPTVPGGFSGIRLQGIGNTAAVNVLTQDKLAGNGVLHIIDGTLRLTR